MPIEIRQNPYDTYGIAMNKTFNVDSFFRHAFCLKYFFRLSLLSWTFTHPLYVYSNSSFNLFLKILLEQVTRSSQRCQSPLCRYKKLSVFFVTATFFSRSPTFDTSVYACEIEAHTYTST